MQQKIKENSVEFNLFRDFYRFRQKWHDPEPDDTWWEEYTESGKQFTEKYKDTQFYNLAVGLFFANNRQLEGG